MIGLSRTALLTPVAGLRLTATTAPQKRGVVIVRNSSGAFVREVALTGAQYAALAQPGAQNPPGVTLAEWTSGHTVAMGKDFVVGDVEVRNGRLLLLQEARTVNGQTVETYVAVPSGSWSGTLPAVTVTAAALASVPAAMRPVSLLAGIVVR